MKLLPNAVTLLRLWMAVALLFLKPLSFEFYVIYLGCGLSDALDGYLARKMGSASKTGAFLDSLADLVFFGVLFAVLLPFLDLPIWALIWIAAIAGLRLASLAVGFYRFRQAAFLHTYANKLTGALLFGFPILYSTLGIGISAGLVCTAASIAAAEELLINATSKTLFRDVPWIFFSGRLDRFEDWRRK